MFIIKFLEDEKCPWVRRQTGTVVFMNKYNEPMRSLLYICVIMLYGLRIILDYCISV